MIDQIISSTLGSGAVSYLNYSHSLYNIVNSLLIANLCMILLTDFTNLCVNREIEKLKHKLSQSISVMLIVLIPVTILTMCYSKEIVSIVYQRGAFTDESAQNVGILLFFYAIGFIPAMFNSIHTQVLHAFGSMKIAMRNSIISFGLNIILSVILSRIVGIAGIALGTTISVTSVIFIYKHSVDRYLPEYKLFENHKSIIKLAGASVVCVAIALVIKKLIGNILISFIGATVLGFGMFVVTLILFKEENAIYIVDVLRRRKNAKA